MDTGLTSFERLTLPVEHPLQEIDRQRRAERAEMTEMVYCRASKLGAVCLSCSEVSKPSAAVEVDISSEVA